MRAGDNPFRSERVLSLRYRLQGTTWPELLGRCRALGYRAAVVGPYGSGKTTLLEDLEPKLQGCGFGTILLRLQYGRPGSKLKLLNNLAAQARSNDIVLLDGAEQIGWLAWRWFEWRSQRAAGLIITLHQPGRLPVLWRCRTSAALLAELAAELLRCEKDELHAHADDLYIRHQGNLREALRACYDSAASNPGFRSDIEPGASIVAG